MIEILIFVIGIIVGSSIVWYILKTKFDIQTTSILNESNIKITSLQMQLDLQTDAKDQMKHEFENLANKIFEQNQKRSNDNISLLLTPFKDQLKSFGSRVDEIYNDETKQRTSLLTEIKNLKELNNQISSDALNLTKALKGENKTQGDWGEMILSKILEQTGLREGFEYETQGSYTSSDGKRLRPDVILHLPEEKDIIIDSKVSLVSYLNYTNANNEDEKTRALKELTKSLNTHIRDLSNKRYDDMEQIKTLDFVLMFIPIEAAFTLAASSDPKLFKTAFENNIMLVSPSTLFVTLRTIENIWRYEHQSNNAQQIAKKAASLYDKFAGFVKDMDNIGTHIARTQKAYDDATSKLSSGRGNLIRQSEQFLDLGVKPKAKIKTTMIESNDE